MSLVSFTVGQFRWRWETCRKLSWLLSLPWYSWRRPRFLRTIDRQITHPRRLPGRPCMQRKIVSPTLALRRLLMLTAALDQLVDTVTDGEHRKACPSDRPRRSAHLTGLVMTRRICAISVAIAGLRRQGDRRQSEGQNRGGYAKTDLH
jgi:hypothetical protein